jgi:YggT family protein
VTIVCWIINVYSLLILVRIVLSWFPITSEGVMASVYGALFSATEPVLGAVRRVVPPLRLGAMGLDLSPLIVLFGLRLLGGVLFGC